MIIKMILFIIYNDITMIITKYKLNDFLFISQQWQTKQRKQGQHSNQQPNQWQRIIIGLKFRVEKQVF